MKPVFRKMINYQLIKQLLFSKRMSTNHNYNYDLFVIGGGSGGLSAAKEAANFGAKVGIADFVKPSPQGTKWGLGGTCVNVGCIPKKMMHYAGSVYEELDHLDRLGFKGELKKDHDWGTMVKNIQLYIKQLNWGYKVKLKEKKCTYYNKYANLIDPHTIVLTGPKGEKETITANNILIAVGGRPNYDYPGSKEYCISSDDLFSLNKPPGKTLVVGGSYIALECAGFLNSLGYDTSVMVRSILLRGFDPDMAERVGAHMKRKGVNFIHTSTPLSFTKKENNKIVCQYNDHSLKMILEEEYDTVLLAIGRTPESKKLGLEEIGIKLSQTGKILVDEKEKTNIDNVFAIGDCAEGRPELTPSAIMAGRYLARRLYGRQNVLMDYKNIATCVFTPLEYGSVGLTEQKAREIYGDDKIKVYHSAFEALEWKYNMENEDECYVKVIVNTYDNERVIGFHITSPHAGEITQGIAVAMKCGLTKHLLDDTVGIHPTIAEEYTSLTKLITEDAKKEAC